jgi:hypothetical protein
MNNLDIVLALFTTLNHRFSRVDTTAAFQATTSLCNFKLGLAELFPTIKLMSSTSKTVLNSYDRKYTTNYLYYHLFEGVCLCVCLSDLTGCKDTLKCVT